MHRNNPKLSAFIVSQETRPEISNKLAALLIVPIQRIPRYRLLLREVLNHTTPFQQDYYTLQSKQLFQELNFYGFLNVRNV